MIMYERFSEEVASERPLSEGDQIKAAIRTMFETSRAGVVYTMESPMKVTIVGVNGELQAATLNLCRLKDNPKAVVMWYE